MEKSIYKILLTGFFVIMLFAGTEMSANAEDLNKRFERIVENCYRNPEKAQAFDKNMRDVTQQFLKDNHKAYNEKDYIAIKYYIAQNIRELSYSSETECHNSVSAYALSRSKTVEKECVAPLVSKGILTPCYAYYVIRGNFHYDPNTSKITSTGKTSLTDIIYDKPGGVYLGTYGMTTNAPRIVDNGYKVIFSGSIGFYSYVDATYVEIAEDYGTFYSSVEGVGD